MGAVPLTRHTELGKALRALRTASGRTGESVARRAAMSAGKLSKIENCRIRPTLTDVDLILGALGVSDEAKAEFLEAARAEATEATAWRLLRRMGPWKHQQAIDAIEERTAVFRVFQGQLIPGLLQTPEYMAAIFSLPPALPQETRARTVAARLDRQRALYRPGPTFRFLICEHVLRWLVCDPTVMAVQLDRLVSLSRLPNVTIGVLPLERRMPDFPMTCFSLYDNRLVLVETFHSEIATREPKDVATYTETFERFASAAAYGEQMRALVEATRDGFLREREGG
ncbi:helix-turn-helix transcriptional regulator [Streptomyces sp. ET3-23]|uniref:helix-turn-helix domain-containing protein n=1 Tax=Streptomyces sp. ET3-23 TaxID=2885643 RepID=UPI0027E041D6|nr:helix-turn-helix transcriptional regulator [Streptomyces sp. ET3-23]